MKFYIDKDCVNTIEKIKNGEEMRIIYVWGEPSDLHGYEIELKPKLLKSFKTPILKKLKIFWNGIKDSFKTLFS